MKRGDVVLIVAAGDLGKPRPAVIVQSDELGDQTKSIIVCPMSSEVSGAPHLRPVVMPTPHNGLRAPSQIMTDKVVALARDRFRGHIGVLDGSTLEALDRAILIVLGLAAKG